MAYNAPASTRSTNGLAIAGMVLSIVGVFVFSIILGPLGIIFSAMGLSRSREFGSGRGMAIAGIVIGVIDVVIFIVLVAAATHGGFRWHV
jgi:hypothetical protein